jgi:hypothetical protein
LFSYRPFWPQWTHTELEDLFGVHIKLRSRL